MGILGLVVYIWLLWTHLFQRTPMAEKKSVTSSTSFFGDLGKIPAVFCIGDDYSCQSANKKRKKPMDPQHKRHPRYKTPSNSYLPSSPKKNTESFSLSLSRFFRVNGRYLKRGGVVPTSPRVANGCIHRGC